MLTSLATESPLSRLRSPSELVSLRSRVRLVASCISSSRACHLRCVSGPIGYRCLRWQNERANLVAEDLQLLPAEHPRNGEIGVPSLEETSFKRGS